MDALRTEAFKTSTLRVRGEGQVDLRACEEILSQVKLYCLCEAKKHAKTGSIFVQNTEVHNTPSWYSAT